MLLLKKLNLININSSLIILLPFTLISGPFLPDLSIIFIGISFLYLSMKEKKFKYYKNYFFYFFIIFYIYINVVNLFINQNFDSLKISISYIRFMLFSLGIWFFLEKNNKILNKLLISFVTAFSILIIDGYFQYFFGKNIIGYALASGPRVSSFFGDELILGSYLSRLFPIFFGIAILFFKTKKKLILISIIFVLSETLVFLSGERASLFYLNLSAFFIIILIKNHKLLRFITLIFSLLIIIILINLNQNTKSRIVDLTVEQTGVCKYFDSCADQTENNTKDHKDKRLYIFTPIHQSIYQSAYYIYLDNKLFGIGIKNFRKLCNDDKYKVSKFSCSTHPHNSYLQFLTELGIFGFIFLIFIFFSLIYFCSLHLIKSFKKKQYFNDFEICLLAAMLITLWPFIPTGNFFNNWLSTIYYFPIGIFLWSYSNRIK
jgi:O-antigen ligase